MERLCYKCGRALNSSDYCVSCELENDIYSRLEKISDLLYNRALELTKLRDLSTAIKVLNKGLSLNKRNTKARNLLGLLYFETGETDLAIKQWLISKKYNGNDNLADYYLDIVKNNQSNFDKLNTAVTKYNQAIKYIKQGSYDLATIQLKKVISLNNRFIKAYLLLSLCYCSEENITKAKKTLNKILLIDSSNFRAKKYLNELEDTQDSEHDPTEIDQSYERSYSKQPRESSLMNSYVQQLLFIIVGGVIGLSIGLFLIAPSRINEVESLNSKLETEINSYESQLAEITESYNLEKESRESLEILNEELSQTAEAEKELTSELEKILLSVQLYQNEDLLGAGEQLYLINDSVLGTHPIYSFVENFRLTLSKELYDYGRGRYFVRSNASYNEAITYFTLTRKLVEDEDYAMEALYLMGIAKYYIGDYENALVDFTSYTEKYPEGSRFYDSEWYISQIQ